MASLNNEINFQTLNKTPKVFSFHLSVQKTKTISQYIEKVFESGIF